MLDAAVLCGIASSPAITEQFAQKFSHHTLVPSCRRSITLSNQNKFGAMILAAMLLLAPISSTAAASRALSLRAQQDSDVPSDAEQAMFTKGQNLYLSGRYDQAAGVLQDFIKTYPKSIIIDLTLLWLGRSYMQLGKFQEADDVGQRLRAIKDTPFADIYEGELQAARRENPTRNASASVPTGGGSESRNNANAPTTRPLETRTATANSQGNSSVAIKPPQKQQQQQSSPSNVARNNPNQSRQPLLITNKPANTQSKAAATSAPLRSPVKQTPSSSQNNDASAPSQVARLDNTSPGAVQQRPRVIDRGRGRRRQAAPSPVTNPPATNASAQPSQQVASNNRQVALNNPPRTSVASLEHADASARQHFGQE
jgi:tetratricopeptide (TPR) repeat protein